MGVRRLYAFGPFLLDPAERVLLREGRPVPLTPKVFDVLLVLVENGGHLLGKKDLMEAVWPDSFVEEGNLTFTISSLRKALGEDRREPQYIETVPRSGYRFVAGVTVLDAEARADADNAGAQAATAAAGASAPDENGRPNTVEAGGPDAESGEPPVSRAAAAVGRGAAAVNVGSGLDDKAAEGRAAEAAVITPRPEAGSRGIRFRKLPAFMVVLGAAAAVLGLYLFAGRTRPGAAPSDLFRGATVTRLTTTRNATDAAISPDGRYVVYVVDEAQQRGLWLRQVATNSHVQLDTPSDAFYADIFFSRDSNYVYYVRGERDERPSLYQMPVTGGTPRKLIENMTGPIGLSPDGRRFATVRDDEEGRAVLTIADAFDGGHARDLIKRGRPDFMYRPAWSPDGEVIACLVGTASAEGQRAGIVEVRVSDGAEKPVGAQSWKFVNRLIWLSDGSGLLANVSDFAYGPYQIWQVSYPGGEARKVTSDLSNYSTMSLTADSKTLVAVQSDIHPYVWVAPEGDAARARQLTSGPGTANDYWGFSWTADGRILYVSTLGGNQDIWVMNADGGGRKQVTFDAAADFDPSVSPDGRHVVFASERSGKTKIWRMEIDGGRPAQLTAGDASDFLPRYSPDGRWVFYSSKDTREGGVWKVPAEGGEPVRLTSRPAMWPSVSPDGRLVACWYVNEQAMRIELALVPAEGGEPVRMFEVSPSANTWAEIRWTPDGRGLTYVDAPEGVGNIWLQPAAGGQPRQLTDFKSDRIFRFDWSRDGRQLVCSRGAEANDVVLIGGLR
jgi:Tol biopolymer transport system component/DNA-binding winged helix-turn-helix (wHTH) protein